MGVMDARQFLDTRATLLSRLPIDRTRFASSIAVATILEPMIVMSENLPSSEGRKIAVFAARYSLAAYRTAERVVEIEKYITSLAHTRMAGSATTKVELMVKGVLTSAAVVIVNSLKAEAAGDRAECARRAESSFDQADLVTLALYQDAQSFPVDQLRQSIEDQHYGTRELQLRLINSIEADATSLRDAHLIHVALEWGAATAAILRQVLERLKGAGVPAN